MRTTNDDEVLLDADLVAGGFGTGRMEHTRLCVRVGDADLAFESVGIPEEQAEDVAEVAAFIRSLDVIPAMARIELEVYRGESLMMSPVIRTVDGMPGMVSISSSEALRMTRNPVKMTTRPTAKPP